MRMASIFALADQKREIGEPHLNAAMAIWEHSERSLRYIFKGDLDPHAEKLLAAINAVPAGLTLTEIRGVFGRHVDALKIKEYLEDLLVDRVIERVESKPTGGARLPVTERRGGRGATPLRQKRQKYGHHAQVHICQ